jgi:hypothetical protein
MSNKPIAAVATMGIDIGKNSFHVVGLDQRGAIVLRQKWSRGQIEARLAKSVQRDHRPRASVGLSDSDHGAASRRSGADSGRLTGRIIGLGSNPRKRADFVRRAWKSLRSQHPSKLMTRVRFSSPAPMISIG